MSLFEVALYHCRVRKRYMLGFREKILFIVHSQEVSKNIVRCGQVRFHLTKNPQN